VSHRYFTLDVFTSTPLAGNPLAVVLDADDLSSDAMLAIAGEFNLSETVFVCTPRDPVNTARIRIFCVTHEMPFAGHPTVGSAVLIATLRAPAMLNASGGLRIVLEEEAGLVPCDVRRLQSGDVRAVFTAPKISGRLDARFDPLLVANAIGIDPADIGFDRHELSLWDGGLPYVMVPVRSLETLAKAHIADRSLWRDAFGDDPEGTKFASIYVYTRGTPDGPHAVRARMFKPGMGMPEDPATGSAASAFAGAAVAFEQPGDGQHQLIIGQGYEMGRPSEISLDLTVENGALRQVQIGGSAVIVSEGTLML
jgi:trans-2,3-dihydro-3-hydroxyanthranilate isomerase